MPRGFRPAVLGFFVEIDQGIFQGFGSQVVGAGVDIHEHRGGAQELHHLGGGNEGEGGGENGVPQAHAFGHKGHEQGIGPRGAGDGVPHPDIGGQALLQLAYFRTQDVLPMGEDALDFFQDPAIDFFCWAFRSIKAIGLLASHDSLNVSQFCKGEFWPAVAIG